MKIKTLFCFGIASLLFALSCKRTLDINSLSYLAPFTNLSEDSFALVFLSSIEGLVEPCGCTADPLGGIARFSAVYQQVKTKTPAGIALIDTGNLLFDSLSRNEADLCQDTARIDLLLSSYKRLGLSTLFFGPYDNARGPHFSADLLRKYTFAELSPVGTPQRQDENSTYVQTIKAKDFEMSIIAVSAAHEKSIDSLRQSIQSEIKAVSRRKKNKTMIAISGMASDFTHKVFNDLPGIDLVIDGRPASFDVKPLRRLGNHGPFFVEGGRQGQYFTVLVFENLKKRKPQEALIVDDRQFEKNQRIALLASRIKSLQKQAKKSLSFREFATQKIDIARKELDSLQKNTALPQMTEPSVAFHAIPLTRKIIPDPKISSNLHAYNKSIPVLVKKCEENIACPKAPQGIKTFVGVNVCKTCHLEPFLVWEQSVYRTPGLDEQGRRITRSTGHSKAWQTLVDVNKTSDRSCVACHSIGFMEPGGYCKTQDVDFRKNVQCESCHGPGSLHAQTGDKRFINRHVPENLCRDCHNVPHIQSYDSFNYDEKLTKILGKGHGEKLLRELTHKLKSQEK